MKTLSLAVAFVLCSGWLPALPMIGDGAGDCKDLPLFAASAIAFPVTEKCGTKNKRIYGPAGADNRVQVQVSNKCTNIAITQIINARGEVVADSQHEWGAVGTATDSHTFTYEKVPTGTDIKLTCLGSGDGCTWEVDDKGAAKSAIDIDSDVSIGLQPIP